MNAFYKKRRSHLFWLLAFIEFFERYGFYIVMALMILLLTNRLGWSDAHAYTYVAGVTALIYIAPLAGGWVTDRYFDNTFSLLIGSIFLCLGYLCLSLWHTLGINLGISILIIGMAFFKFAPSAMIGELYHDDKTQLDRLFVIFYVSINVGSLVAFFCAGWLRSLLGWYNVFLVPASGLFIATLFARAILRTQKKQAKHLFQYQASRIAYSLIGCAFVAALIYLLLNFYQSISIVTLVIAAVLITLISKQSMHLRQDEKRNLVYIFMMCLIAIVFFVLYNEQSTLITLFAERLCQPKLLDLVTIHASAYSGFDAMWILILSPVVSLVFKKYDKTASKQALMLKFGAGLIISGLGFYVLYAATMQSHALNSIHPIWVCLSFALQALGEILVSALGLSLMAKWAPKALYNALMGGWFMVVAIGSCLSGLLNTHLASVHKGESFMQIAHTYEHSFLFLTLMSVAAGLIVVLSSHTICRYFNNI